MSARRARRLKIGTAGGKPFTLPLNAVTETLAFLGRRGTGKSYAAMKLAEEMHAGGAQLVALDPVGVWWGLRLAEDGVSPGIEIPVLGGLHGDIPIEPTAGAVVADLVVDRGISVIIDVSQFETDTQKATFAAAFGKRLFYRKKAKPGAIHLFLEEAQEFVSQNPQKGEEHMLHAYNRIWKIGRNFGIGGSLISQRPQEVNKKSLNLSGCMFAFQLAAPHERKVVRDWMSYQGATIDIDNLLPTLAQGTAHVDSPQWLGVSATVEIGRKWTFDSSKTPEVGTAAEEVRPLSPIDLKRLSADMAATIEKTKAEDPKELKKQIAELQRELRQKPAATGKGRSSPEASDVRELRGRIQQLERDLPRQVAAAEKPLRDYAAVIERKVSRAATIADRIAAAAGELATLLRNGDAPPAPAKVEVPRAVPSTASVSAPQQTIKSQRAAATPLRSTVAATAPERDALGGPERKILDAAATLEVLGVVPATTEAVAAIAGYRPTSGHYTNVRGKLNTAGLIQYPQPNFVALTDDGRALAVARADIVTLDDLHRAWLDLLSGPQRKILEPLLEAWPESLSNEDLAERAGFRHTSGHYTNIRGGLRTLGALDYPEPNHVRASDLLFPEGLRWSRGTKWPRLSETLPGPRHPEQCQSCGSGRDLQRWREHGDRDEPEQVLVILCGDCEDELIEKHPRLYSRVDKLEPIPGAMWLCEGCRFRDGLRCTHPDLKANGGSGLMITAPRPTQMHVYYGGRRGGEWRNLWSGPPTACAGRVDAEAQEESIA